mmetsp:Transcript_126693/g.370186  ORF Transcript_126693/g.370186 Transcript_126693/m.370186 type:complete len:219 (-) Transcript_126693:484-1140(-)
MASGLSCVTMVARERCGCWWMGSHWAWGSCWRSSPQGVRRHCRKPAPSTSGLWTRGWLPTRALASARSTLPLSRPKQQRRRARMRCNGCRSRSTRPSPKAASAEPSPRVLPRRPTARTPRARRCSGAAVRAMGPPSTRTPTATSRGSSCETGTSSSTARCREARRTSSRRWRGSTAWAPCGQLRSKPLASAGTGSCGWTRAWRRPATTPRPSPRRWRC